MHRPLNIQIMLLYTMSIMEILTILWKKNNVIENFLRVNQSSMDEFCNLRIETRNNQSLQYQGS
jgi:hypothetical protein